MKKVLIVTLEQGENYGGIMQTYALQRQLDQMGFQGVSTWRPKHAWISERQKSWVRILLHIFKPSVSNLTVGDKRLIGQNTQLFIDQYVRLISPKVLSRSGRVTSKFGAIIVGSDQVWRAAYVNVAQYLLASLRDYSSVRTISYAASFGCDDLSEYSPSLLRKSAQLASRFDAISVREDSAVKLVGDHWKLNAECHIDPTLLLPSEHYRKLIDDDKDSLVESKGNLFVYMLDGFDNKGKIIDSITRRLDLQSFEIMPPKTMLHGELRAHLSRYQLPRVTQWLKSFMDADYVVTDSFHGCVFAIIFNKPFIAIGNKERGLARFTSLLRLFGLEDRLVLSGDDISEELIRAPIDWQRVNAIKERERQRSYRYLMKYLSTSPKG